MYRGNTGEYPVFCDKNRFHRLFGPAPMRILVVDDEKIKRITLADDIAAQGHEVVTAADGQEAIERLAAGRFDVVVTDLKMPKLDGIELLKQIKQGPAADMEVIMMTAYGSIPVAVEAVKLGAFDFLTKPFRNEDILPLLARIERQRQAAGVQAIQLELFSSADVEATVVGRSAAMDRVKRMIEVCVKTDANVLLYGETGVGKDLIAATIHRNSHRRDFPYVKVGCTLFPPQLIESELYGHERGSFTGAEQQRKGRFDLAEGGTLYLDDVDDIPLEQQPKLLRAIEEKVFERVGGTAPIKADVRIIASTKRNLLEKIGEGSFREDLYYRLDVLRINIPPLRERLEDVPLLAEHLLKRIAAAALPDRAGGDGAAFASRLAGQRPRVVPHARTDVSDRRRQRHGRDSRRRDRRARPEPASAARRISGGDRPRREAVVARRPAQRRRQQIRRRRRVRHEALDVPRQAGEARAGVKGMMNAE